jgi:tetratricopeptide (TPR) repeat protein
MQVRKSILIAIVIAVCFAAYFNTLFAHFVWDDTIFITHNPYLKSFRFLPKFFVEDFWNIGILKLDSGYYRPLLAISFMFDYLLWHAKPFGYHLVNLLLHTLASVLLFLFLELLLKNRLISLFSSLVFSAHPIHTESVSFVSGRVDLLPLIFFLLSLIFFLKYTSRKSPSAITLRCDFQWLGKCFIQRDRPSYPLRKGLILSYTINKRFFLYLFSLACFFLSLLAKEMAVTLPLIVLCVDYLFLSKRNFKDVIKNFPRFHLGFFVILGLYLLIRFYFISWSFMSANTRYSTNFFPGASQYWRIFTAIKILVFYIRLLLFPYNLKADYFFPAANSLFEPSVFIGVMVLISLVFIAIKNIKNYPILSFSIIWFFITVLPVSNIIPIGNIFAERYMYIPSVGFCIAIGFLFSWLLKRNIKLNYLNWKISVSCVFILLIIALSRVTFERNKVWNNEFTLWNETAKAAPESPRSHCNLASAYYTLNFLKEAIAEIKIAVQLYPNYYEAFDTLGHIYFKKGLPDEAIKAYKIAISISPERETAYDSLAVAYGKLGQYKEAINADIIALKHNPYLDAARYNLALSYSKLDLVNEAIKACEEYLKINPAHYAAHVELGYLYYKKGDNEQARLHWLAALKICKDYKPAIDALKLLRD